MSGNLFSAIDLPRLTSISLEKGDSSSRIRCTPGYLVSRINTQKIPSHVVNNISEMENVFENRDFENRFEKSKGVKNTGQDQNTKHGPLQKNSAKTNYLKSVYSIQRDYGSGDFGHKNIYLARDELAFTREKYLSSIEMLNSLHGNRKEKPLKLNSLQPSKNLPSDEQKAALSSDLNTRVDEDSLKSRKEENPCLMETSYIKTETELKNCMFKSFMELDNSNGNHNTDLACKITEKQNSIANKDGVENRQSSEYLGLDTNYGLTGMESFGKKGYWDDPGRLEIVKPTISGSDDDDQENVANVDESRSTEHGNKLGADNFRNIVGETKEIGGIKSMLEVSNENFGPSLACESTNSASRTNDSKIINQVNAATCLSLINDEPCDKSLKQFDKQEEPVSPGENITSSNNLGSGAFTKCQSNIQLPRALHSNSLAQFEIWDDNSGCSIRENGKYPKLSSALGPLHAHNIDKELNLFQGGSSMQNSDPLLIHAMNEGLVNEQNNFYKSNSNQLSDWLFSSKDPSTCGNPSISWMMSNTKALATFDELDRMRKCLERIHYQNFGGSPKELASESHDGRNSCKEQKEGMSKTGDTGSGSNRHYGSFTVDRFLNRQVIELGQFDGKGEKTKLLEPFKFEQAKDSDEDQQLLLEAKSNIATMGEESKEYFQTLDEGRENDSLSLLRLVTKRSSDFSKIFEQPNEAHEQEQDNFESNIAVHVETPNQVLNGNISTNVEYKPSDNELSLAQDDGVQSNFDVELNNARLATGNNSTKHGNFFIHFKSHERRYLGTSKKNQKDVDEKPVKSLSCGVGRLVKKDKSLGRQIKIKISKVCLSFKNRCSKKVKHA